MQVGALFNVRDYGLLVTGSATSLGLGYAETLAQTARLRGLGWQVRGEVVDRRDHAASMPPSMRPSPPTAEWTS